VGQVRLSFVFRCLGQSLSAWPRVLVLSLVALLHSSPAKASCISLLKGAVVYDVEVCSQVNPETRFDLGNPEYQWIRDLDSAGRAQFYASYRGALLRGKIIQSRAERRGIGGPKGALAGDTISVYVQPPSGQCNALSGKRLAGALEEACCNGNGDPPCLLGTTYFLKQVNVMGSASSEAGDAARRRARNSRDYNEGLKAWQAENWKQAIKHFEAARSKGDLDIKGHWMLGQALRQTDQCREAVKPLKYIYDRALAGKVWSDEEEIVRRSNFLLARCHARNNDPQAAVFILNGYLLEPTKFRRELQEALRNKDFGWIHTSKEYRDFRAEAQVRLRKQ